MKLSQRELVEEKAWENLGRIARQGKEMVKQIGSVVAPEWSEPLIKAGATFRKIRGAYRAAAKTTEENLAQWLEEQGKFALKDIKKIGVYPDGRIHFSTQIAEKGVDPDTGQSLPGRLYKDPNTIVGYDPDEKKFSWITRPRGDSFQTRPGPDGKNYYIYGDERAQPKGGYAANNFTFGQGDQGNPAPATATP